MPKRTDIQSILVLGAGPIVIGQACEFDYSGSQAVKALKAQGYRVILVNSNPATVMTDPNLADATYVEPLTVEIVEQIIAQEQPDALLPTVGGQTALNLAIDLAKAGVLERHGVELIGASLRAMQLAEDRLLFKETMAAAGLACPQSGLAASLAEAQAIAAEIGRFPILIRASFTLGGSGGGIAENAEDFVEKVEHGLRLSPAGSVLVEESVLGWKEFELEVMRDRAGNFVVVCSIENLDPMGVHTGDSITVAPAQTLTDREYQRLRDQARVVMDAVGVETGGSNVQFAVDPASGHILVIEMNPRVSRSSALASKATGFPIAKIAALLAVGYTLDEIRNDITRETVAAYEPSLDYVVVKLPRWAFEKFPGVDPTLGPQMKSVGEAMAIGRTFKEALNKGFRSLEIGVNGWKGLNNGSRKSEDRERRSELERLIRWPNRDRLRAVHEALWREWECDEICELSGFDPWFVQQLAQIVALEKELAGTNLDDLTPTLLLRAKRYGLADARIAELLDLRETEKVRALRRRLGILPTYARVDTCAAEFEAFTPYLYSSYEREDESNPGAKPKVVILGGGPNRIGQGIEFDYCCCHAAFALQDLGYEAIMVNCNPETVSTDYDTSDRLYFEPLTLEDVLNIIEVESGERTGSGLQLAGVVVQFGGQTPLNLADGLEATGVPILGTSPDSIALAEDRGRFGALLAELDIPCPANGIAHSLAEARAVARQIGYPVVVRPSFVLGGRAMAIVESELALEQYMAEAVAAAEGRAILIDQFLEDAYEVDVDAVCDGERVVIGGVMQHIEEAGIHSGDSACVLPPYKVSNYHLSIIRDYTRRLGLALGVRGLMNVQYAIKDDVVYVLEVNPRASRTVPFVSKATGVPLARIATEVMVGRKLDDIGSVSEPDIDGFFVKEAVLPFIKFPEVDTVLGPEMRSTGEVMGFAPRFGHAFAKAQIAAGNPLPQSGGVLITVNDFDKGAALKIGRDLHRLGFQLYATPGTAAYFHRTGLPVTVLAKAVSGEAAYTTLDAMREGKIQLIINTPLGPESRSDGARIRRLATRLDIPLITTLSAAQAAVTGIRAMQENALTVTSLQTHHSKKQ
ncbi:MAG: carbamoyl-phosphate synthase large subunit [Caldilineales bacterium]|nr:carbamoyl-phosphate synthase large subunit [Caldilineales bacterium]